MTVDSLTSILEEEFSLAFNVKDEKALKRSLTILMRNPGYLGHSFRESPDIDSGKPRTVIPGEAGQF